MSIQVFVPAPLRPYCGGASELGIEAPNLRAAFAALVPHHATTFNSFLANKVLRTTDLGKSYKETKSAPVFPKDDGRALANIWSLETGAGKKDLWCGVEPASLFRSDDGGDTWEMATSISN